MVNIRKAQKRGNNITLALSLLLLVMLRIIFALMTWNAHNRPICHKDKSKISILGPHPVGQ